MSWSVSSGIRARATSRSGEDLPLSLLGIGVGLGLGWGRWKEERRGDKYGRLNALEVKSVCSGVRWCHGLAIPGTGGGVVCIAPGVRP